MNTTCPSCGAKNIEGVDECAECGADLSRVDLPKPLTRIEQSVMELPLTALGIKAVPTIAPEEPLGEAIRLLAEEKLDLLAVAENERLLGVLSVRDIVTRVGSDYAARLDEPVRSLMTRDPETLPPDASITFAINRMDVGGYRHVPVVQQGRLIGVVSTADVIRFLVRHSRQRVVVAGRTTSHGTATKPAAVPQ